MQKSLKPALGKASQVIASTVLLSAMTVAASDTQISYVENGLGAANRWVERHPKDIAVIVRHGAKSDVDPETIEYWLRKDFDELGCSAHFIFERGSQGSAVGFVTLSNGWGPFSLADSRKNVATICTQHLFEVARGLN